MIQPQHERNIRTYLSEISELAKDLPRGQYYRIANRLDKVKVLLGKQLKYQRTMEVKNEQTQAQVAKRIDRQKLVINDMIAGRKVSCLDGSHYGLSQMHTTFTNIRAKVNDGLLPYEMKDEWFKDPVSGSNMKRYWFEPKAEGGARV